ncbi:sensor histidine kinase [Nocardiopsis potens]|uniref:sensor histidine kinase n=1 Tax=Nocardiopsis potens TaxID=1246458 RepID=UPI00034BE3F2|nr:ATP-binding protein [Nocardiopsis potens]
MMSRIGLARRSPETAQRTPAPQEQEPAPHGPEGHGRDPRPQGDRTAEPAAPGRDPHGPQHGPPPEGAGQAPASPAQPSPYARPQSPPHHSARPEARTAAQQPGAPGGEAPRRQDRVLMTDVVAGMAMRDLNLVDALLGTVEELEDSADDPALMDKLFEIDNLATRMRRHSENLLLLTEQSATDPDEEPVPVLDVARAAISEIKDYARIQVGRLPNGYVLGTAADDISHLLAELLDNATEHSPEHAQVVISAQPMADGGLLYVVEDEGIGIPREEIADLNARLSGPPVLDQRALRHMGLYVASRIAYRHGLTVQLEARAFRGVSAYAVVPARLLTDRGPRPERGRGGMSASRNTPSLPPKPMHPPAPLVPPPSAPLSPGSAVTAAGLPRRSAHRDPAKAALLAQISQDLAAEDEARSGRGRRAPEANGPVEDRAAMIRDELGGFLEGERAAGREFE